MRVLPAEEGLQRASLSGGGYRDAESLFRSKPIADIRTAESSTRSLIQQKQDDLRRLVGTRYRDLIDSADSILLMKQSSLSISSNLSSIHLSLSSLSLSTPPSSDSLSPHSDLLSPQSDARSRIYSLACRVKYLVDAPEHIWGCLDESMFLEAASRFVRSKHVHLRLNADLHDSDRRRFGAVLQHQWQIVDGFKSQISQRARDRLSDRDLPIASYADAMAAISVIDELSPERNLFLLLDSRKA